MKNTAILIVILSSLAALSFVMRDDGIAGRTGSPGETTCNTSNCHTGNVVNASGGSIIISAPTMSNWSYVPGEVYPINVTVSRTGVSLFGFGFEALQTSGANGGSFTIINPVQTTLKSAVVLGNVRTNVVHQLNGGASPGSHTFTFNWNAPLTDIGNITFYAAGNAANGNNSTSGDFIYTTSQVITPSGVGLNDLNPFIGDIKLYPVPASGNISIAFKIKQRQNLVIELLTLNGKVVDHIYSDESSAGTKEIAFSFNNKIVPGIYFVRFTIGESQVMKKIVVL